MAVIPQNIWITYSPSQRAQYAAAGHILTGYTPPSTGGTGGTPTSPGTGGGTGGGTTTPPTTGGTGSSSNWWGTGDLNKVDWDKFAKSIPGAIKDYRGTNQSTWAKTLGTGLTDAQVAQNWFEKWGKDSEFSNAYTKLPQKGTTPPVTPGTDTSGGPKVVPGDADPKDPNQINVVDYAGEIIKDPSNFFTTDDPKTKNVNESMFMSDRVKGIDENAAGTNVNGKDPKYSMDADGVQAGTAQTTAAQAGAVSQAQQVDPRQAATYQAQTTQQNIKQNGQATAQQGQLSQGAIIDPNEVPQIDMQGAGTGVNADGTINQTGQALKEYASQNISNIIDTSTPAGKALAQQLGDGNYTDSKATMKGQLEILQSEFVGPNGEPKIPAWAAATSRNVQRIASFKGMSGTAATAAMAQALMEASLPVAQADAQFFQTVTLQNLSNKQASTINRANVLAKMELSNMDSRMAAAVQNSKNFLDMDLANLANRQQSEIINTQARVQSILEDAKAVNTQRMFTAESQNDMNKFYDELNTNINMYNTSQLNEMRKFNVTEKNKVGMHNTDQKNAQNRFNADLENNREQFYKNMQYNIDIANAKWRQTVTLTESEQAFEANATDVKNMVGVSVEQLNQIWDRSDALLDYLWKSSENQAERNLKLTLSKMDADTADKAGFGSMLGSVLGNLAGNTSFVDKVMDWLPW